MSFDKKRYRPGLGRDTPYPKRSHLYEMGENEMDFQNPMCRWGWNRDYGEAYSIWRGNVGEWGTCKICIRRAEKGLPGVPPMTHAHQD